MKNIIERLREVREQESGFTLVEIMLCVAALGFISYVCAYALIGTTEAAVASQNKALGQNQGDVMDTAREITDAAFLWVATHNEAGIDATFTKTDITTFSECDRLAILGTPTTDCDTEPYLDPIPESYVWGVGNYHGSLQNMCAVVYEEDPAPGSLNANFSAENPAMWERQTKNHTYLNACASMDGDKDISYNYGDVSIPPRFADQTRVQIIGES